MLNSLQSAFLRPGSTININAYMSDGVAVTGERGVVIAAPGNNAALGNYRLLVVRLEYDDLAPPYSLSDIQNIFDNQVVPTFKEMSYGKFDIRPRYLNTRIGRHRDCTFPTGPETTQILSENSIDPVQIDGIVYLVGEDPGCPGGLGQLGKINQNGGYMALARVASLSVPAIIHELGHNLGLLHANRCDAATTQMFNSECVHREYGNSYDIMGKGVGHFNALYKERLGWLDADNMTTVTESGRYTITPLQSNQGKRAIKIVPLGKTSPPLYLEFRQATGTDATRLITAYDGRLLDGGAILGNIPSRTGSYLMDLDSSSLGLKLPSGGQLANFDEVGVTIGPILSLDEISATFDLTLRPAICVRGMPVVRQLNIYPAVLPTDRTVRFVIFNGDSIPCGESSFQVSYILPSGWTFEHTSYPQSLSLFQLFPTDVVGAEYSGRVSRPISSTDDGTFSISVRNIQSGQEFIQKINSQTFSTPLEIRDVRVDDITLTTAVISWVTDEIAYPSINYGTSSDSLFNTIQKYYAGQIHSFTVTNLIPNTRYYFKAKVEGSGRVGTSNIQSFTTTHGQYGDLNLDGVVTIRDIQLIVNFVSNVQTPTAVQFENSDFDKNGKIDIVDQFILQQYVLGKVVARDLPVRFGDLNQDSFIDATDQAVISSLITGRNYSISADSDLDSFVDSGDSRLLINARLGLLTLPARYGDLNDDFKVSTADKVLIDKMILGTFTPTARQKILADLNNDGAISSADSSLITQFILGKITVFPVEN